MRYIRGSIVIRQTGLINRRITGPLAEEKHVIEPGQLLIIVRSIASIIHCLRFFFFFLLNVFWYYLNMQNKETVLRNYVSEVFAVN